VSVRVSGNRREARSIQKFDRVERDQLHGDEVMENADSEDEPGTESGPPTAETRDLREEDRHMSRDALALPQ